MAIRNVFFFFRKVLIQWHVEFHIKLNFFPDLLRFQICWFPTRLINNNLVDRLKFYFRKKKYKAANEARVFRISAVWYYMEPVCPSDFNKWPFNISADLIRTDFKVNWTVQLHLTQKIPFWVKCRGYEFQVFTARSTDLNISFLNFVSSLRFKDIP